jgi:hypothetical protein
MSVRTARRVVFVLLGLYVVFLTYPGLIPFNRIRPLVFGLPFVLFWIALWIVLVGAGFLLLDAAETRSQARPPGRVDAATSSTAATRDAARGPEGT